MNRYPKWLMRAVMLNLFQHPLDRIWLLTGDAG